MNRLTFTKEFKKHEKIGHILCLKPEKLIEWEEKLSQYEDIGEPKELIKRPSLDENGLAQCGCGGVPVPYSWDETLFSGDTPCLDVTVACQKCGMGGNIWHESKLDAKNWWNAAMGWRAEE